MNVYRFTIFKILNLREYVLQCSLEPTHDFDPTLAIVSAIPTSAKSESLVPPGNEVVWSRSRVEMAGVGRSRSCP